ncbi:MAG: hypothetical protein MJ195_02715 [Mycoplasmoidaceae bacterium]|nr:hypothetical protein [Mycoplasmoidaceae bacterium]
MTVKLTDITDLYSEEKPHTGTFIFSLKEGEVPISQAESNQFTITFIPGQIP